MVLNKSWFCQSADLRALTEGNKADLTVSSTRNTIRQELERRGSVATRATGTVIVVVEGGVVKGSRWFVTGDLGTVIVKGDTLGLSKSVEASINMRNFAGGPSRQRRTLVKIPINLSGVMAVTSQPY